MAKLVSKTYGDALFELALEEDRLDSFFEEVKAVSQILEEGKEPTEKQIDKIADMVMNRTEEKYVSKIVYFDGLNGFDPDNYTLTPSWYIDQKPAEKSPYEGMKLEDIIKEARKERQERDKKMTEIEDELLRLVKDLGID